MSVKDLIAQQLEGVKANFANDLNAMSTETLLSGSNCGGRLPYDFTYEVVAVNDRITNNLKGIENGPWPFDGWPVAPDVFKNREHAVSEINRSVDELVIAWSALDETQIAVETTSPGGSKSTALSMALMCIQHMSYHDAQLNYIQSMTGDMEVHWT